MTENKPNYYAIIPANVRYDKSLKANEKLLYGEITCLTQSTGECFASNEYFANLYDTTKETVSRWISNLKKYDYIDVVITYKKDSKTIDKRIITLLTKKSIPYCEKNQYPIDEKIKDNITSINITRNNISYDDFLFLWNEFATTNKLSKVAKLSESRKKKILARTKDFKDFRMAFEVSLKKANESSFLLNGNFFCFDWLIENDTNILKVLEDKYKDKGYE